MFFSFSLSSLLGFASLSRFGGENEKGVGEMRGICGERGGEMTLELGGNYGCATGVM